MIHKTTQAHADLPAWMKSAYERSLRGAAKLHTKKELLTNSHPKKLARPAAREALPEHHADRSTGCNFYTIQLRNEKVRSADFFVYMVRA
jgi:hypothetical protein